MLETTTLTIPFHTIVMLVLYLMLGIYTVFTAILYYHWKEYSTEASVTTYTLTTYFVTTIPLLLIMVVLALNFI